ncbi:MAG: DNA polymerase III subunit alpha, partial [Chitinophagaceae bacterium]
ITDRNSLAGIVRGHAAAKKEGLRFIVACRLDLLDGFSLLVYPEDRPAYSRLCNLLSKGNLRTEKGECHLYKADVYEHAAGMQFVLLPPSSLNEHFNFDNDFIEAVAEYSRKLPRQLFIAAARQYQGDDAKYLHRLEDISERFKVPLIATNDVHYHTAQRRQLQDVLTCIREKCTIQNAGFKLHPNAERFLKPVDEMHRLFRSQQQALDNIELLLAHCHFSLDELKYEYPEEITSEGRTPNEELAYLSWKGAEERYGLPLPQKTIDAVNYELKFITAMDYAPYFLTVYDIVRFAKQQKILCQGRGSAANSTVCYCLGITSVDPSKFDLLFERFISSARNEPPDIDVDFEHERREEVMQYIYNKYGRDRAAIIATVTNMHQKGAIRDVGKAMGLSVDMVNRLSGAIWEFTDEWFEGKRITEQGFDATDKHLLKVLDLTRQFMGFPRQLGQHTGGFVITKGKLIDYVPVLNARMADRTNVEWNKDDIDALGFMKIDVLALGMLTCIRKCFDEARQHYGLDLTLANIPQDDERVYDMICKADTIGVFQIESRAQQTMLPRLRPRTFYDLVIEVAIVRPGPIQGDMVHPYLRRRNKEEDVSYPSKELEAILSRTLGVPLFQEQAMKIAIVGAGFTPAEADELRRSMATFKMHGMVTKFERKLIDGMTARGYPEEYAYRVFKQLEGFGSYGFPESHAASFALLVYVSCWIKCFYPDVFLCGLLNSQPMGFYQPAQLIACAQKHGVDVRAVDINFSFWDNVLEERSGKYCAVRLGFRQVKGLRQDDIEILLAGRQPSYTSINQLRDIGLTDAALEKLAEADAFRSIDLDRRKALWEILTKDKPQHIFKGQPAADALHENIQLPIMSLSEHVAEDYASTALSLKAHPVSFVRPQLQMLGITIHDQLKNKKDKDHIKVAGLVLVRQRPGTAGGVCFMTIEDETGFANLVIFESLFETYRKEILLSRLIMVEGQLQIEGAVIHVIVKKCYDISKMLRKLVPATASDPQLLTLARPDETSIPVGQNKRAQVRVREGDKVIPGARNFK